MYFSSSLVSRRAEDRPCFACFAVLAWCKSRFSSANAELSSLPSGRSSDSGGKGDKKPIRIYLQDGSNDLDNEHGNWWLANQQMNAALKFRDYDLMWSPDEGDHGPTYAAPKLPEAMQWIWRPTGESQK